MVTKKINTADTVSAGKLSDAKLAEEVAAAKAVFEGEPLVPFSVPPALKRALGETFFIGVNGVYVNIPVDGKKYEIPATLAEHGYEALQNLKI